VIAPAGNYIADPHPDHVTAAQLAVDGEVDQRSITKSPMLVEPEANDPSIISIGWIGQARVGTPGNLWFGTVVHRPPVMLNERRVSGAAL